MNEDVRNRLQAKTPQERFVQTLQRDFRLAPRVAQAVLDEAQDCLYGMPGEVRPGQQRVMLLKRSVAHGKPLREGAMLEVTWTLDAGPEDEAVLATHGPQALRRVRILRLLDEALAQEAVATQEDLARALQVSVRTIKRDCAELRAAGMWVPTRGKLQGIGRGQTHKAQIVARWLEGATYDQIAHASQHALSCVQRYVQTFLRVVHLQRRGLTPAEIALALQVGQPLVGEYLALSAQAVEPLARQRLEDHLQRLNRTAAPKRGAR